MTHSSHFAIARGAVRTGTWLGTANSNGPLRLSKAGHHYEEHEGRRRNPTARAQLKRDRFAEPVRVLAEGKGPRAQPRATAIKSFHVP